MALVTTGAPGTDHTFRLFDVNHHVLQGVPDVPSTTSSCTINFEQSFFNPRQHYNNSL